MPRQEHVLTVFVASPDDVGDERTKLEEVIRELNVTWSRHLGVRLDLVRWETHAYPGAGIDPQDVINCQIPDDYDMFVGIMWCRYGTPTGRAGSGTEEEFKSAKARFDEDPSAVKLMLYFKDEAIPPSRLDPAELSRVNEFRDSLGEAGTLYWKFTTVQNFEQQIRMHLSRQVQDWKTQFQDSSHPAPPSPSSEQVQHVATVEAEEGLGPEALNPPHAVAQHVSAVEAEEDDLGILDLIEISEERFEELNSISERISQATEDLGQKMENSTVEMAELPTDSQGNVNRKAARRLIAKAAADMDQYTTRVEAELPIFSDALNTALNALSRTVSMSADFEADEAEAEQTREALDAIVALRGTLAEALESTGGFRDSVAGLPRMTSELNRAKRGVASALDKLIDEFANGQSLLSESETIVRQLLSDQSA